MKLVLATRRSALALAQSRAFARQLSERSGDLEIEELQVVTTGDRVTSVPLANVGGKGLFTKEIEEALLDGRAQIAVHSFKDVPAELSSAFAIACVPVRADPRDVLVGPRSGPPVSVQSLPEGARIGTSSLRRATQLSALRPDLRIVPLRGNVDTRIRKLDQGEVDAIVLAAAGLERLGLSARASETIAPERMIPAPGQGALAIECLANDAATRAKLSALNDSDTELAVRCERGVMAAVGADCKVPFGAYATRSHGELVLRCFLVDAKSSAFARIERAFAWPESGEVAERIGREIGRELFGNASAGE